MFVCFDDREIDAYLIRMLANRVLHYYNSSHPVRYRSTTHSQANLLFAYASMYLG
jgi:hypothetical protein